MAVNPERVTKAPQAHCEECPLRDEPHVLGAGPDRARFVVVGEAPGAKEVRSGVPFIGPSGRLLDKVLTQHGINREEVYVTNTVLCRPPENRTPTAQEIRACRDRLVAEIRGRSPDAVLALGAPASKTLLEDRRGITTLRVGGAKESPLLDGIKVVATFHPAAALRNPDLFPSIVSDVRKLVGDIKVGWEPPTYEVYHDWSDAQVPLAAQLSQPVVALDIENAPPFDRHAPDLLCIGISHEPNRAIVYSKRVCDDLRFRNMLNEGFLRTKFIMQNGKYDIQHLWGVGVTNAHVDHDTMLAHYATDERKGTHALEQLSTEFLGAPNYKQEAKIGLEEDESLADLPPDILYRYNASDAANTYNLMPIFEKDMQADGVRNVYDTLLIPGSNALARVEFRGLGVDENQLEELDLELTGKLREQEKELSKWVANPRSPLQIKKAFGNILREDFEESTDKLHLLSIIESDPTSEASDFARGILSYRENHKEWSTYVRGLAKHIVRGRVYSSFWLHGTESGRLSSRKPNLQNIKQGRLRSIFTADEGKVLMSADYKAIELRIAALFFRNLGDSWLWSQFINNRDLHREMASRLFGDAYSQREYVRGKTTTFSILYDIRAPSLGGRLRIPIRQADRLIRDWKKNVPGLEKYWAWVRQQILEQSYLRSEYGRLRRFWLITDQNRLDVFREGYNFLIQSPASDITLTSLIRLDQEGFPIVVTVHDSLTFEIHENVDYRHEVKRVMEDIPEWDIPMVVELKVGQRWS